MATYGVVNTANCKFTKDGNIVSGKYYDGSAYAQIENGNLVMLDGLVSASTNREIFKVIKPAALTSIGVGIVCTPEVIYSEELKSSGALDQFVNPADHPITVGMLAAGDFVDITDACITCINDDDDIPSVGNYVTITNASTKWTEKTALGGTEALYGKIINRYIYNGTKYMNTVHVLKAN